MSLYHKVSQLPLRIERYELAGLAQQTPGGWIRCTTVVRLFGAGTSGEGEDVTYQDDEHEAFQSRGDRLPLAGEHTLDGFSRRLDALSLFERRPADPKAPLYRRWAFESAALDLALRQAKTSLAETIGIRPAPVRFVVSLGLGNPPSLAPLERLWESHPGLAVKLDADHAWTDTLVQQLAETGAVTTVDLKGQYKGPFEGTKPDAGLYRLVAQGLPQALLEDPGWTESTRRALAGHLDRVTYDAPICSVADILELPGEPKALNIKPSRFGFVSELFRAYEYCAARDIRMYGGGQFELGPGREQIQYLAALFHPDGFNDVAPSGFNTPDRGAALPRSPLQPSPEPTGFRRFHRMDPQAD